MYVTFYLCRSLLVSHRQVKMQPHREPVHHCLQLQWRRIKNWSNRTGNSNRYADIMSRSLCVKAAKATKNHLHDLMPLVTTISTATKSNTIKSTNRPTHTNGKNFFSQARKTIPVVTLFRGKKKKIPLQKLFSQVRI